MGEIWIPWTIITLFLLLSFLRPFFKFFWYLDGLVWLPVLSFLLTLCLFPAYGFRPECIPLLGYTFLLNIANLPQLVESIAGGSEEKSHEQGLFLPFIELILFFVVIIPLFAFSPKISLELLSEGVQTRTIHNKTADIDYFLRIYGPQTEENRYRALVFLAPPEAGSVYATDRICAELANQGFAVISYSRSGLDAPAVNGGKKHHASAARVIMMWRAFRKGTEKAKANRSGIFLESERQKDMEFLLPFICRNRDENGVVLVPGLHSAGAFPVFLIGYGAAGSAAAYLFEQPGFAARFSNVKGMASVESRLWSAYQPELPMEPRWLPQPDIPVLYLVSDRAFVATQAGNSGSSEKNRQNHYRAVLDAYNNSTGPAALAAFEGAGPFAYSDFSLTHPAYSFLFPGNQKNASNSGIYALDTSWYISNFFLMLLMRDAAAHAEGDRWGEDEFPVYPFFMPEKRVISSAVLAEQKGLPEF